MASKVNRVLNLSADKVNSYAPDTNHGWKWWHIFSIISFLCLLGLALCSPSKAHAANPIFTPGTHLQCRVEVVDITTAKRYVTFKAFGSHQITKLEGGVIQLKGDADFPPSLVNSHTGELFAVMQNKKLTGVCRNEKNIGIIP